MLYPDETVHYYYHYEAPHLCLERFSYHYVQLKLAIRNYLLCQAIVSDLKMKIDGIADKYLLFGYIIRLVKVLNVSVKRGVELIVKVGWDKNQVPCKFADV